MIRLEEDSTHTHTHATATALPSSPHIPEPLNWKALCCNGGLITPPYCPPTFPIMPWLASRWLGETGEEKGLEEPG